ncbi:MAG: hypothetical protein R6U70_03125 [Bacillota bacterium]
MDLLTLNDIRKLTPEGAGPRVSLYMPTHRVGTAIQGDQTQCRNLLRQARADLAARGMKTREVDELLRPADDLTADRMFWQHQSDGLALFAAPRVFRYYRLPLRFNPLVTIADRFHVKPLLPLLTGDGRFFVLALSQNRVRFFQGSRFNLNPVEDTGNIPTSLEEALGVDDMGSSVQYHSTMSDRRGGHTTIYHGQGYGSEDAKKDLRRFFTQIDRGVRQLLRDDRAPLVLAGVDYLLPIYRECSSHPNLAEGGITGSPDRLSAEELHKEAWDLVRDHFRREEEQAAARYRAGISTGLTSDDVRAVVVAAHAGRVDSLFTAIGSHCWGIYCEETARVELTEQDCPDSEDLLDLAAVYTLNNGGAVYAVPRRRMPAEDRAIAALFRY